MKIKASCTCNGMSNMGDAAPRIWECEVHGKTGMAEIMMLILRKVSETNRTKDELWDEANALLKKKQAEYWADGRKIYFCEDFFSQDLREYFWPRGLYRTSTKPNEEPPYFEELSPSEDIVKQIQESTRLMIVTGLTILASIIVIYNLFF